MVDEHLYKFNRYQTPITKELKKSLRREVYEDVIESITSIQFIKNLIAPEEIRGFAKDQIRQSSLEDGDSRKHYNDDRIVVDVTNPHILEGLDFFRERAIYFEEHGTYTHLTPNPNPKSEYAEFWKEELRRWKHGLVRPSDGEWIPGYLYFYWNYSPIWLVVKKNESDKKGERKRAFPRPWLGDYIFFHYIDQAQNNGKHVKNLKSRGVGVSFKCASMSPRNLYVYPGAGNVNFHLANEKGYLQGDKGLYGKVLECLDHIAENTPLPKLRLIDGKKEMVVQLGYQDEYGVRKGLLSSIHAISLKDNPEKARGTRGVFCHYEEDGIFDNLEKAWNVNRPGFEDGDVAVGLMMALGTGGCLTAGNKVYTADGDFVNIETLKLNDKIIGFDSKKGKVSIEDVTYIQPYTEKECVKITTHTGRSIECSKDHPIYSLIKRGKHVNTFDFEEASALSVGSKICVPDKVDIFGKETFENPRLVGLLIGDGSYGYDQSISFCTEDDNVKNYIESNFKYNKRFVRTSKSGLDFIEYTIHDKRDLLRKIGIVNQTKLNKRLPVNIQKCTKETICELLGGYYDADGYIKIRKTFNGKKTVAEITLTSIVIEIIEEVQHLLHRLGIHSRIRKRLPRKNRKGIQDVNPWYELTISDKRSLVRFAENITLLIDHKQKELDRIHEVFSKIKENSRDKDIRLEKIVSIKETGVKQVFNLTANTTNTYLGNGIITHNTEGASFEGSEKLFYNPLAYNIYGIPNVFDKNADGSTVCGHFWGAYLNRNGCYDSETGEPDVIQALIEIHKKRFDVKYNSRDPNAITQAKAEYPITPQEAVLRTEGTVFPVSDLKEHMESIAANRDRFLSEHYVGELVRNNEGIVTFKPSADKYPIRSYDVDSKDREGCLEIFEMPRKNANGEIPYGRYIAGVDPVDSDTGNSLFSIIIMDLFTDRIVAEYTGRPRLAEEAYEIALRTLEFYNAQANYESNLKGLFSYFDKFNKLHLLTDVPQIVKDIQNLKHSNLFGNNAKGTRANKEINKWGRKLQADWMLHPVDDAIVDEDSEDDTEKDNRLKLHTLRSLAYIDECIRWNSDGNFDRVSAAGMLFILREDRFKITESAKSNVSNTGSDLAEDNFFNRNYDFKRAMRVYDDEE